MKLYRPVTVLVGVLFVLLGGLARLAGPVHVYDEQPNRVTVDGVIGQKVMVKNSSFEIIRLRFVKTLVEENADDEDPPQATDGIFVAVDWEVVGGSEKMLSHEVTLKGGEGTVYEATDETIGASFTSREPGFAETGTFVFEVNPADTAGLELWVKPTTFWTVVVNDYRIDLGIPDQQTADELIANAKPEHVLTRPVMRVAS
ncbi:hypothetical protein [Kribbella deserti]|uniref:DUF4352 domain-containing protein n=1 Tax=Kribbella deserti TaxID=1926257 RepID=A0ABV6QTS0_9ACTN